MGPGNDDCGDDLSGLGKDIVLLSCDWDNDWAEAYPTTRKELRQGKQPSSSSASRQTDRPRETVERPSSVVPDVPGPRIIPPPAVPTGMSFTRPGPGGDGQCQACSSNKWKHSPAHTRKPGQCRWHDVESRVYECPACAQDFHKGHKLHWIKFPGLCRFAIPAKDMEPKREGHHPREPRRRARDHPTAGADAHDCGDQEDDASPEYQHTDDEEDPDDPKALRKDKAKGLYSERGTR